MNHSVGTADDDDCILMMPGCHCRTARKRLLWGAHDMLVCLFALLEFFDYRFFFITVLSCWFGISLVVACICRERERERERNVPHVKLSNHASIQIPHSMHTRDYIVHTKGIASTCVTIK